MRASTEEFLYTLLWSAGLAFRRPSPWNSPSFERWAFRVGFDRRVRQLADRKLIERKPDGPLPGKGFLRLTEQGRVCALGGADPVQCWNRGWDHRWRLLIFDLPSRANVLRTRLRRYLKKHRFGYLQQSVWLTPDPLNQAGDILRADRECVESLSLFEARPCDGASDAELVAGAWDLAQVDELYRVHRRVLAECPVQAAPKTEAEYARLRTWIRREMAAWKRVLTIDPLLPRELHPANYEGPPSWDERCAVYRKLCAHQGSRSIES